MKFHKLPIIFNEKKYYFNKIVGALLVVSDKKKVNSVKQNITNEIKKQYQYVLNPLTLNTTATVNNDIRISALSRAYAKLMVITCKHSFLMAILLAKLPFVRYNTTNQAITAFQKIYSGSLNQRILCLPRVLFAIATSKSFRQNGVAFIGVFLPSKKMHAWIIEADSNPDKQDDVWICYRPVLGITKNM